VRRILARVRSRPLDIALVVAPCLMLAMAYHRRWLSDDGYIDLRVVKQLLAGNGLVFNVGERVEAFTSPLWLAILSLVGAVGISLEAAAVTLGIAFATLGVIVIELAAASLWRRRERHGAIVPVGALAFAALPPAWDFATSGMEGGLTFLWLALAFWLLARRSASAAGESVGGFWSRPGAIALVVGLGPLIRPDLGLFTLAYLVALIVDIARLERGRGRAIRRSIAIVAIGLSVPLAYQIFRMGYYGCVVPNTALAKEATLTFYARGLDYALDFLASYWLAVPLTAALALLVVEIRGRLRDPASIIAAAPVIAGLLDAGYVIRVGGDFMHARMLLPAAFGVLLPIGVVPVAANNAGVRRWIVTGACLVTAAWAVVCATWLRVGYAGERIDIQGRFIAYMHEAGVIVDEREWHVRATATPNPVTLADAASPESIAHGNIAALLADAAAGRRELLIRDAPVCKQVIGVYGPQRVCRVTNTGASVIRRALRTDLPPEVTLVTPRGNIGAAGFASPLTTVLVDRRGLADPIASHLLLTTRGRTGHEKMLFDPWVIARYAALDPAIPETPDVAAAREALACGELHELTAAVSAPLDANRFFANLVGAFRRDALRIPADPREARTRLCP